jgi:hypothetical protein
MNTTQSNNSTLTVAPLKTPGVAFQVIADGAGRATSIYTFDQAIVMKSGQLMSVCMSVYAGAQDQTDAIAYAGDY